MPSNKGGEMSAEQLVRRIFDEIINRGDLDAADELMTEDFVDHGPTGDLRGVAAFKEMVSMWRSAVPDVHCTVENVFSDGEHRADPQRPSGGATGRPEHVPVPAADRRAPATPRAGDGLTNRSVRCRPSAGRSARSPAARATDMARRGLGSAR